MNINPNPAIVIEVKSSDTFDDFASDVATGSHMSFRPTGKDPKERQPDDENRVWKVELEPDSCYPIIWLLTEYIASPEQFAALTPFIQEMLTKAVKAGVIEADWLQDIRTLIDLKTPPIPERFLQDGAPIKMYLNGDLSFVVQAEPVQPEME
jgi:hypothetical protein